MKKIHMISHTHWDREWYFTTLDTQVLALKSFREIFKALEGNNNLKYHLDGQSSILEDYLNLRPEDSEIARTLIEEKRLFVGPWYTQPDLFNINCESIFRNLKYGKTYAENMGHSMNILYLPDTFGSNAQIPQIAKAHGIDNIILRRGYDDKYMGNVEMYWESLNGDRVKTAAMPFGYSLGHPERGARYRNFDLQHFEVETFQLLEKIKTLSKDENIMCPIGGDQVSVDENFDKLVEKINENKSEDKYILSTYEEYMESLSTGEANIYTGEFRYPRYSRVHKTIGSSRYDIKLINHQAEQFILRVVEPLMAFAQKKKIDAPKEMLDKAWKLLLESHAHDSMGGCNSDATNKDVIIRCEQALQIAQSLYNLISKTIVNNFDEENIFILVNGSNENKITSTNNELITDYENFNIVNADGQEVKFTINKQVKKQKPRKVLLTPEGEVETDVDEYYYINNIDLIDVEMLPLSYKRFTINCTLDNSNKLEASKCESIENSKYKISFDNGKLNLEDKENEIRISEFISFEDMSDDGDLYDYSPLDGESPIEIKEFILDELKISPSKKVMHLRAITNLPVSLAADRSKRSVHKKEFVINFSINLTDELIRFKVDIKNNICDHRLRVIFNPKIKTESAIADLPFGFIERKRNTSLLGNWKGYTEMPVDIEPMQNSVSLRESRKFFSFFGKGLKEYQVLEDKLAISLFKSVGFLGKDDLYYRPGRASGRVMPAPDGQLLKDLTFEFAISLGKTFDEITVNKLTEKYLNDSPLYQKQELEKEIHRIDNFDIWLDECSVKDEESLIEFETNLTFSAVDFVNESYLIRLYNPTKNDIIIPGITGGEVVDALGNKIEKDKIKSFDHFNILF